MVTEQTFLIVGASLAGAKAAQALREGGFAGRLVLVGDDPGRLADPSVPLAEAAEC